MSTGHRRRSQRGQTLMEFALMMPLFAVILFGLLDFGRVVFAQNTITEAAREASRVASLEPSESAAKYTKIRATARNAATGVGLTDANITGQGCSDCFYPEGTAAGGDVVVTINASVSLMTPVLAQLLGGTFALQATSRSFIR